LSIVLAERHLPLGDERLELGIFSLDHLSHGLVEESVSLIGPVLVQRSPALRE